MLPLSNAPHHTCKCPAMHNHLIEEHCLETSLLLWFSFQQCSNVNTLMLRKTMEYYLVSKSKCLTSVCVCVRACYVSLCIFTYIMLHVVWDLVKCIYVMSLKFAFQLLSFSFIPYYICIALCVCRCINMYVCSNRCSLCLKLLGNSLVLYCFHLFFYKL